MSRSCTSCGVAVALVMPVGVSEAAQKVLAGIGVVCDPCGDRLAGDRERREQERVLGERIRDCGLPEGLIGVSWNMLDRGPVGGTRERAMRGAAAWARLETDRLVLTGPVGTGKTTLVAAAMWSRLKKEPVRYVSVAQLMAKAGGGFGTDERREATKVLTGTATLVLDDLDKVKPSEWAVQQLYVAIDKRVQAGRGLAVTTNLTARQAAVRYGEPIASRLFADGIAVHELPGDDRRI